VKELRNYSCTPDASSVALTQLSAFVVSLSLAGLDPTTLVRPLKRIFTLAETLCSLRRDVCAEFMLGIGTALIELSGFLRFDVGVVVLIIVI